MDMLLQLKSPVHPKDILEIERLNSKVGSIISPFPDDEFDRYSIKSYLFQSIGFGHNIYCILDTNITSEIASMAGDHDLTNNSTRNALTLLAFLQLAEVSIDPGISIAEYNTTSKSPDSIQRLHNFRLVDNLPSTHIVDIILGRATSLNISLTRYKEDPTIFNPLKSESDLPHWDMYYTFTLKIFLLANSKISRKEKLKRFILWSWEEFLFSATATTFALVFFSEIYGKMLKGVNSKNLEIVLKGIKNATWDMAIASYWSEKNVKRNVTDPHYIFCTEDKALREVAILLLEQTGIDSKMERIQYIMGSRLSQKDMYEIVEQYDRYESNIDCKTRKINSVPSRRKYFENCIEELENEVFRLIQEGQSGSRGNLSPSPHTT